MIGRTIFLLLLLLVMAIPVYSQEDQPLIYLGFSKNIIKIIDGTTLEELGEIAIPVSPDFIELSPDKKIAYVCSPFVNLGAGASVVDLVSRKTITSVFLGEPVSQLRLGPDGFIYALMNDNKQIGLINSKTFKLERKVNLPSSPLAILFSPDGTRGY